MRIEFLWFDDCPNHDAARDLLLAVIQELGIDEEVMDVDASDPVTAERLHFPGSPTIRVNGIDIEPGFVDPGEYSPRCRVYMTEEGLKGIPEREWVLNALQGSR